MKRLFTIFLLFIGSSILLFAQDRTRSNITNSLHIGDCIHYDFIQMQPCRESFPIEYIWDFSHIEYTGQEKDVMIVDNDCLHTRVVNQDAIFDFSFCNDSIYLQRFQSALIKLDFGKTFGYVAFPLAVGDSLVSQLNGVGTYCQQNKVKLEGTSITKTIGRGSLILPSNDTLRNVLKIQKYINAKLKVCQDSSKPGNKGVLDYKRTSNEWYFNGCFFPILKAYDEILCHRDGMTLHNKTTYVASAEQTQIWESIKEGLPEGLSRSKESVANVYSAPDIIYRVSTCGKNIKLDYSLSSASYLSFILSSSSGIVYKSESKFQDVGEYQQDFSCIGLPSSEYILYINVNDKIYSEKIFVKQ